MGHLESWTPPAHLVCPKRVVSGACPGVSGQCPASVRGHMPEVSEVSETVRGHMSECPKVSGQGCLSWAVAVGRCSDPGHGFARCS